MKMVAFILAVCCLVGATASFWLFMVGVQQPTTLVASGVLLGLYVVFKSIVVYGDSSDSERGMP
ncbi:hypothetical protein phiA829_080 [Aeromonas phage phiA8-29]|uniref:Uncharacterized protein n=1 Tax=Aeromonas phage phiA8-29 TaxID=1978922 RepID=A0A1W6DY21_9CAUD|nr:hypothetical protein HWB15_gp081 [Aeromonas phage phiA8-29]ARK07900.1 hypothetical protein phiA829_080 [Aeromonas phage phiA8-29]